MKLWMTAAALAAAMAAAPALAAPPTAIFTDPPADAAHPAHMDVLHIPSGGVEINAIAYVPAGAGPHPVVVLLHGLPGNEKNLDLAQAMRRAGWTVVAPNYRGSWGSPGTFSFRGNLDDARAVLAYVRDPAHAAALQADPKKLVLMGHSMGGWVTSQIAGADPALAGAVLISAADVGRLGGMPEEARVKLASDNMEALAGVTAESMAAEMATLDEATFAAAAPGLARHPLLVLTADDGLAPNAEALAADVRQRGGKVSVVHVATDHGWNTARIRLETEVLNWLAALP
ncbi:alpha/beta hydrolase family protein [Phenylobacterium sp.]|uniref:alpha/beta hydrolase family protein n=1 Tax=Phenylobacterium sp. TaxID=1871053 RepID=UPI0035B35060